MVFFSKIFGKKEEEKTAVFKVEQPCKNFQELLERYCGIVLERQQSFYNEVIGNRDWNVDIDRESIRFGDDLEFKMQIIGTFSFSSETWLWSWANEASNLPPNLVQNALQLKQYGETHHISEFTEGSFDYSEEDLHKMGIIATGFCKADAYYLANYGQGVMVLTITDERIKASQKDEAAAVLTHFPNVISYFEMNHKNAFTSYLAEKNFQWKEVNNTITATRQGNTITASFDEHSRLVNLTGNAK